MAQAGVLVAAAEITAVPQELVHLGKVMMAALAGVQAQVAAAAVAHQQLAWLEEAPA
jgi:hypothetical protein